MVKWNPLSRLRCAVIPLTVFMSVMDECWCDREGKITDVGEMRKWLEKYNEDDTFFSYRRASTQWDYYTNLTEHNKLIMIDGALNYSQFDFMSVKEMSMFDWENVDNATMRRMFRAVKGSGSVNQELSAKLSELSANLVQTYSTAKVCDTNGKCLPMEPDIESRFADSRDWDELVWLWKGWRDASGQLMRDTYRQYVEVQNEAATSNGFDDRGEQWRYGYETDNFSEECERLYLQVAPLYKQLHTYVRRKLLEQYPEYADQFPTSGHIPAHLQGNMWSQSWANIFTLVAPYKDAPQVDVTNALEKQNYNATAMFRLAEEFFTSLGLEPMTESFWENSMLEKPEDREVVCHASAWDFRDGKDFRIKQCTQPTMTSLITVHHEMGHVQYYLNYRKLPNVFKGGANPGFHEAVGDVMSLSVSTPSHLYEIGLLADNVTNPEADMNFLMLQALKKVAFLPFGYLIDQWRWKVFSGEIDSNNYNSGWWDMRCQYQGMSPPVSRSEDDFDPGAKFHIPNNTPYIRYFVSFIIQFQMHRSLCEASGHTGPLHLCDIYRSREAGKKLGDMLKLGSSKPWPDALEQITGQRTMDGSALLEYFKPLHDWLIKENEGDNIGWESSCPPGMVTGCANLWISTYMIIVVSIICSLLSW